MDLNRQVQQCHPPHCVEKVNAILQGFRNGTMETAPFWIQSHGKFLKIDYFPVKDADGNYLGALEVLQDATEVRSLEGEKRLL
jgi:DUF438 domain-containing protein